MNIMQMQKNIYKYQKKQEQDSNNIFIMLML